MLAMYRIRPDFRICMYLNVAMMATLAFSLIRCAKRLRGKLAATDVFFPLVLLGLAQGLNFIWGWQVEFFASTALALCILLLIAEYQDAHRLRTAVLTSICLAMLVGCGAHGLALVPALALWVAALAVIPDSKDVIRSGKTRLPILGLSAIVLGLVALYLVGYQRVPYFPTSPSIAHTLKTALQFLTMSFGPAVKSWWPMSGLAMVLILAIAGLVLISLAWKSREQRSRAVGFFLFLCAMTSLAAAIGLGRNGFEPRYITLAVPVLCCVYLVFATYPDVLVPRRALPALLAISCACLFSNTRSGLQYGRSLRHELGTFEAEVRRGMPPYQLIRAHLPYLHPNTQLVEDYLPMLRTAKVGQFRFLRDNPVFQKIRVALNPVELHGATWSNGAFTTTGPDSAIVFAISPSARVSGIHLEYNVENESRTPPLFSIAWRSDSSPFTTDSSYYVSPTGDRANWERGSWLRIGHQETEMTVWVCDRISHIRIKPDVQPCVFRLRGLTLLVDPAGL